MRNARESGGGGSWVVGGRYPPVIGLGGSVLGLRIEPHPGWEPGDLACGLCPALSGQLHEVASHILPPVEYFPSN